MALQSFWKGYLKLSLVTCPVSMIPATTDREKLRFNTLNAKTGDRVVSVYLDAVSGKTVAEDDEAKGYPRGENDFVVLEDEELEAVALTTTRTINIENFVPAKSIASIWYDKAHYLMPNDVVGEEAFSVIRAAMEASEMVGISRLVLYRRERAVLLQPHGKGIILWTLRYGDEVRDEGEYFRRRGKESIDGELMDLVSRLIRDRRAEWQPEMLADPVQANLMRVIASKNKQRKTKSKPQEKPPTRPNNVVNIMDALRKSIANDDK